jgi:hypothetical protein
MLLYTLQTLVKGKGQIKKIVLSLQNFKYPSENR